MLFTDEQIQDACDLAEVWENISESIWSNLEDILLKRYNLSKENAKLLFDVGIDKWQSRDDNKTPKS